MRLTAGFVGFVLFACATACGKSSSNTEASVPPLPDISDGSADKPYEAVEGEEATQHLAPSGDSEPTDAEALIGLLAREIDVDAADGDAAPLTDSQLAGSQLTDSPGVAVVSAAQLALLEGSEPERAGFDAAALVTDAIDTLAPEPATYEEEDASGLLLWDEAKIPPVKEPKDFDYTNDKLDLSSKKWKSKKEILISTLGKIPVRDQGQRGTCAAHTMAGFLEYKLVKQYPKTIKTIDLSEERIYMMAKSDLWDKGGGRAGIDGGSWMAGATWLSWGWDGFTVKSDPTSYHIPLEVDCPYDRNKGANELHIPQRQSCGRGVVSTKRHTVSYYLQNYGEPVKLRSNAVRSAQEIFDQLQKYDLPVPAASNITDQWFKTSGMITLKNEPAQPTTYGHGYLIVGARKIDEKKYPGEGGMCWVIKNSWGKGWGQQGLACVTLAWFNKFHQGYEFMFPLELNVDLDYIKKRGAKAVPNTTPGGKSSPAVALESNPPKKVAVKKPAENIFSASLRLVDDDSDTPDYSLPDPDQQVLEEENAAEPAESPVVTDDGYTVVDLVSRDGTSRLGLYKIVDNEILIRGVYPDDAGTTQDLTLAFDGSTLALPIDGRDPVAVGSLRDGRIALCVDEYRAVCHFNLVPDDGRLLVGLSEAEYLRQDADPNASYQTLASLSGWGIEYAPVDAAKVDVRLLLDGEPTNGIRLAVDPATGGILHRGKEIGSITKLALCSGEYTGICRFAVSAVDRSLHIFFKVGQGR